MNEFRDLAQMIAWSYKHILYCDCFGYKNTTTSFFGLNIRYQFKPPSYNQYQGNQIYATTVLKLLLNN